MYRRRRGHRALCRKTVTAEAILGHFREQAIFCDLDGSKFTSQLISRLADDFAGGGIVVEMLSDEQSEVRKQVTLREEKWDYSIVDSLERQRKYGHKPKLILLTGKVGVDKKTVAKELEKKLFESGAKTYFLAICFAVWMRTLNMSRRRGANMCGVSGKFHT